MTPPLRLQIKPQSFRHAFHKGGFVGGGALGTRKVGIVPSQDRSSSDSDGREPWRVLDTGLAASFIGNWFADWLILKLIDDSLIIVALDNDWQGATASRGRSAGLRIGSFPPLASRRRT